MGYVDERHIYVQLSIDQNNRFAGVPCFSVVKHRLNSASKVFKIGAHRG